MMTTTMHSHDDGGQTTIAAVKRDNAVSMVELALALIKGASGSRADAHAARQLHIAARTMQALADEVPQTGKEVPASKGE